MRRGASILLLLAAAASPLWPQVPVPDLPPEEQLAVYRNLGKAFYENPTTQQEAVEQFERALALQPDSAREQVNYGLALLRAGRTTDAITVLEEVQQRHPEIPHTWFNLGVAFKKEGEYEKATEQFEGMVRLVPDEAISRYNLGYLYRLADRTDEAVREFEQSARLDPSLAGPRFQLYNAYRAAGRADDAQRELAVFQQIRQQQAGAAIPEDLDWSFYAEIYDIIEPFEVPPPSELRFDDRQIASGFDSPIAGLALLDFDGDSRPDLVAWSSDGVHLFQDGSTAVADSGLDGLEGVRYVAPGDFNNDGLPDLAIVTSSVVLLYINEDGRFQPFPAGLPSGDFDQAVWLDYDRDYDLDLVLLGETSALARNNGAAGFSDLTADFPFVEGRALDAIVLDLMAHDNGVDLLVTYADRSAVLYRDRMGGKYEAVPLDVLPSGARQLAALDWNNDGWTDLVARLGNDMPLFANREGVLQGLAYRFPIPETSGAALPTDWELRGITDFLIAETLVRGLGEGRFDSGETLHFAARYSVAADFNQDGKPDIAAVFRDGTLHLLNNQSQTSNSWVTISLEGVRNLKLAPQARVEVRAGSLYSKQTYHGVPLTFGLGQHTQIDAIRITWPNGLIQNEVRQPVNQHLSFQEAQRLSGSCPMIFTWNGEHFQFITDVLGVAPLGASAGDGEYFPVDHDEYIQIPAEALALTGGHYEIRITEELREVAYLDEVQFIAVDHPSDFSIFTSDKFIGPPFPEFRLYGVKEKIYPRSARDHHGSDVLAALLRTDAIYPDSFQRDFIGVAELHHLDLDFGDAAPDNSAILVLQGWVDWADGSAFRAVSQESPDALAMPSLQVKNAAGQWETVIEDMGMPAGKPKAIVVDLTGKFLTDSREVRIVSGMALYWDEIFLSEHTAPPPLVLTALYPAVAELRFRGFSRPIIHPERKQPERFDYQQWLPVTMWNPTPGMYTRYGDVRPLLTQIDDRLVVMGSGDELRLLFSAQELPPLPRGWVRSFLLKVDGWAKDQDANTAYGQSVEPLPFHGMSEYPYPPHEQFPDTPMHRDYLEQYNTRPALRLLRPLADQTSLQHASHQESMP